MDIGGVWLTHQFNEIINISFNPKIKKTKKNTEHRTLKRKRNIERTSETNISKQRKEKKYICDSFGVIIKKSPKIYYLRIWKLSILPTKNCASFVFTIALLWLFIFLFWTIVEWAWSFKKVFSEMANSPFIALRQKEKKSLFKRSLCLRWTRQFSTAQRYSQAAFNLL